MNASRVLLVYFLMTGMLVNIGVIMLGEIACTRLGGKVKRFFVGKLLTLYMLSLNVPEHPGYDKVDDAPKGVLDITALLDTTTN